MCLDRSRLTACGHKTHKHCGFYWTCGDWDIMILLIEVSLSLWGLKEVLTKIGAHTHKIISSKHTHILWLHQRIGCSESSATNVHLVVLTNDSVSTDRKQWPHLKPPHYKSTEDTHTWTWLHNKTSGCWSADCGRCLIESCYTVKSGSVTINRSLVSWLSYSSTLSWWSFLRQLIVFLHTG